MMSGVSCSPMFTAQDSLKESGAFTLILTDEGTEPPLLTRSIEREDSDSAVMTSSPL